MLSLRRFSILIVSLVAFASETFLYAQKLDNVQTEKIFSEFTSKIGDKKDFSDGAIFMIVDGRLLYLRAADVPENKTSEAFFKRSIPLGETSATLVSLMSANMQSKRVFDADVSVSDYFSLFRSSNKDVKKASVNQLLSYRSGVPYLAEKIPQTSTPQEFFDTLATMNFSLPASNVSSPKISVAIAGYAMAYADNSQSKNLKKAFVACSRKYLFEPLKIKNVKYRNFDKFVFPAVCYTLDFESIAKWLECETSPKPPMLTSETIALRRHKIGWEFSQGWQYVKEFDAVCSYGAISGWRNCITIFKIGKKTIALAMFLRDGKTEQSLKIFRETISAFNKSIKQ